MARGKKAEKVLTPEEKLEQVLVPAREQPYGIPGNWCWIRLLVAFDNQTNSKKKVQQKDYLDHGLFAIVDQGQEIVGGYTNDENLIFKGDLPVIIFGDHTRCIKYIDFPFAQGADGVKVLKPYDIWEMRCFYYALQNVDIPDMGYRRHYPLFSNFSIPLPPLPEQQRIVDRIDHLFAKLDEAKKKAQAALDGFELRKSAILHKAFTGELTEQWRQARGVGLNNWKPCIVADVCKEVKVGIVVKPSQYYSNKDEGTPAFRSANVRECRIDDFDWVYLNEKGMLSNKRSVVHTGDVLVVRSGNPGVACVVSEKFDGYNAIDILIAVPNQKLVCPDFLCLFTNSPLGKRTVAENKRGMALTHFNVKGYSNVEINIPSIAEQKEIICILDKLLKKERQAKAAAESVLTQIDTMKKSILSRAFRGELGTNDPSEESALELLKTIL